MNNCKMENTLNVDEQASNITGALVLGDQATFEQALEKATLHSLLNNHIISNDILSNIMKETVVAVKNCGYSNLELIILSDNAIFFDLTCNKLLELKFDYKNHLFNYTETDPELNLNIFQFCLFTARSTILKIADQYFNHDNELLAAIEDEKKACYAFLTGCCLLENQYVINDILSYLIESKTMSFFQCAIDNVIQLLIDSNRNKKNNNKISLNRMFSLLNYRHKNQYIFLKYLITNLLDNQSKNNSLEYQAVVENLLCESLEECEKIYLDIDLIARAMALKNEFIKVLLCAKICIEIEMQDKKSAIINNFHSISEVVINKILPHKNKSRSVYCYSAEKIKFSMQNLLLPAIKGFLFIELVNYGYKNIRSSYKYANQLARYNLNYLEVCELNKKILLNNLIYYSVACKNAERITYFLSLESTKPEDIIVCNSNAPGNLNSFLISLGHEDLIIFEKFWNFFENKKINPLYLSNELGANIITMSIYFGNISFLEKYSYLFKIGEGILENQIPYQGVWLFYLSGDEEYYNQKIDKSNSLNKIKNSFELHNKILKILYQKGLLYNFNETNLSPIQQLYKTKLNYKRLNSLLCFLIKLKGDNYIRKELNGFFSLHDNQLDELYKIEDVIYYSSISENKKLNYINKIECLKEIRFLSEIFIQVIPVLISTSCNINEILEFVFNIKNFKKNYLLRIFYVYIFVENPKNYFENLVFYLNKLCDKPQLRECLMDLTNDLTINKMVDIAINVFPLDDNALSNIFNKFLTNVESYKTSVVKINDVDLCIRQCIVKYVLELLKNCELSIGLNYLYKLSGFVSCQGFDFLCNNILIKLESFVLIESGYIDFIIYILNDDFLPKIYKSRLEEYKEKIFIAIKKCILNNLSIKNSDAFENKFLELIKNLKAEYLEEITSKILTLVSDAKNDQAYYLPILNSILVFMNNVVSVENKWNIYHEACELNLFSNKEIHNLLKNKLPVDIKNITHENFSKRNMYIFAKFDIFSFLSILNSLTISELIVEDIFYDLLVSESSKYDIFVKLFFSKNSVRKILLKSEKIKKLIFSRNTEVQNAYVLKKIIDHFHDKNQLYCNDLELIEELKFHVENLPIKIMAPFLIAIFESEIVCKLIEMTNFSGKITGKVKKFKNCVERFLNISLEFDFEIVNYDKFLSNYWVSLIKVRACEYSDRFIELFFKLSKNRKPIELVKKITEHVTLKKIESGAIYPKKFFEELGKYLEKNRGEDISDNQQICEYIEEKLVELASIETKKNSNIIESLQVLLEKLNSFSFNIKDLAYKNDMIKPSVLKKITLDNVNMIVPDEVLTFMKFILEKFHICYCLVYGGAVRDYLIAMVWKLGEIKPYDYDVMLPMSEQEFFLMANELYENRQSNQQFYKNISLCEIKDAHQFNRTKIVNIKLETTKNHKIDILPCEFLPNEFYNQNIEKCLIGAVVAEDLTINSSILLISAGKNDKSTIFTLDSTLDAIQKLKFMTPKDPAQVLSADPKRIFRIYRLQAKINAFFTGSKLEVNTPIVYLEEVLIKTIEHFLPNISKMNLASIVNQLSKMFETLGVELTLKVLASSKLLIFMDNPAEKLWFYNNWYQQSFYDIWGNDHWVTMSHILKCARIYQTETISKMDNFTLSLIQLLPDDYQQVFACYALKYKKYHILSILLLSGVNLNECLESFDPYDQKNIWFTSKYFYFFVSQVPIYTIISSREKLNIQHESSVDSITFNTNSNSFLNVSTSNKPKGTNPYGYFYKYNKRNYGKNEIKYLNQDNSNSNNNNSNPLINSNINDDNNEVNNYAVKPN